MKPLNSKERAKAFYKVTGLFVLCFVLAILLGFSTINVNKMTDDALRKQLEKVKNDLTFQDKVFQPNIGDATRKLQDLSSYKERGLILDDIATSINVSLENIKKEWKVEETDQQYIMYKNIVDMYFALKSAYLNNFGLKAQLEAKESVVITGSGDLQRVIARRDELDNENKSLKTQKDILSNDAIKLKSQTDKLKSQLALCRDSLKICLVENRGYKQQRKK